MKKNYTKPTITSFQLNSSEFLLAGSNDNGINATISGYQSSDDDGDDFSQESDGFSQESLWSH